MDKLKLVKTIVFFLTFLLVFGTLLLLGSIIKKTGSSGQTIPQQVNLNQPAGSRIAEMTSHNDSLWLLIKDGGISDRVIIIDTASGQTISTITLN